MRPVEGYRQVDAPRPHGDRNVTGLTEDLKVAVHAGLSGVHHRRREASRPAGERRAGLQLRQLLLATGGDRDGGEGGRVPGPP
jgi:hypothetical protein